jgi:cell division protein FtsN
MSAAVAEPPDTVTAAGRQPPTEYIAPKPRFAVQLGAFANRSRAQALRRRAADAGFDARLVLIPGSDLVRVRVGSFDEEQEATTILQQLRDRGFTAAVAKDAHLEESVGR